MNNNCKCGGKFISSDIVKGTRYYNSYTIYETIRVNPGYATWHCDKCNKEQKQKLREKK